MTHFPAQFQRGKKRKKTSSNMNLSANPPNKFLLFFIILFTNKSLAFQNNKEIKIEAFPLTLNRSGDNITITLRWETNPNKEEEEIADTKVMDWLGIYTPENSADNIFIGYVFVSSFCKEWVSGSQHGSCRLEYPILNMRGGYQFRLFKWHKSDITSSTPRDQEHNPIPSAATLLAKTHVVKFANINLPEQIHLAFTDQDDEMRVMFVTGESVAGYVRYGKDKGDLRYLKKASVGTYSREQMCDSPANSSLGWREPGFIHDAVMGDLQPRTHYFYQVGSDEGGWSTIYHFVSKDTDNSETVAFLFGDMGTLVPFKTFLWTQAESALTLKWIKRDIEKIGKKPTFISHIGDISYARGYAWLWDSFFAQIEPLAALVPYHVCIGNHEYDWPLQPWKPEWAVMYGSDGGGECGVPYSLRFHMPGNSSFPTGTLAPPTRNLYYSFNLGVVHFVYMSTETSFLQGSEQYAFIEQDLKIVDRKKTPFVVFQGHRPMYTTNYELRDGALRSKMLEHIEPLLVKYKVNLVLWGHVHKYERFCPLKNFTCGDDNEVTDLPVHVVIGMAGQDWQPKWEPRPDHLDDPIFPQPLRSAYRSSELGYTRLDATREKLTLSYIGNHDGEVHDVLEIRLKSVASKSSYSVTSLVKSSSILAAGVVVGLSVGCFLRPRKKEVRWTGLKTEEA